MELCRYKPRIPAAPQKLHLAHTSKVEVSCVPRSQRSGQSSSREVCGCGSRWGHPLLAPHAPLTCPPTHLAPGAPSVSPFPGPIPLHPGLGPPPSGSSVHLGPAFPIRRKDEGPRLAPSLPCGYCSWLEAAPPLFCVPAGASTQLRALGRESRGGALSGMRRHLSPPGGAPCLSQIHPGSLSPPKISFRFRSLAVTRPGPFHALPGQAWCVRRNGLRVPEGRGWGPPPG